MFPKNPMNQPDKREHSEFDIDTLSIEIKGLQHLNDSGEHTMTYYKFFEKNNLLSDKYLDLYFKLTGVLLTWSDGYETYYKPLDCIKVIKLVKNENGKFSLINKYNTNDDNRKIDQLMDGAKFNLYAETAKLQGGQVYYYDEINISNIYTSTLINLNNNTDKRQQEKEKEKEEEQEIIFNDKDLSEAYDKYNPPITSLTSLGGKRKSKGKSNKVAKKPVVSQKKQSVYKEIFGKQMKIYKMPDSRKEYVKYKGELHPISEYKSLMKQKTMAKPKAKK